MMDDDKVTEAVKTELDRGFAKLRQILTEWHDELDRKLDLALSLQNRKERCLDRTEDAVVAARLKDLEARIEALEKAARS